jgi:protein TonB
MLVVSLLLHIAVIDTVRFSAPKPNIVKATLPALDVVLVNAKTETAPQKADVLAQANLDRGGNTDDKQRAKSPLPVPKTQPRDRAIGVSATPTISHEQQHQSAASKPQPTLEQKQQQVKQLEQKVQQVITQINSTPTEQTTKSATPPHSTPLQLNVREMAARSLDEASRLEAELAKEQKAYQERPWRRFVGARAQEDRFAFYVEGWRQKVEKIGNLNYPEEAKAQKLYGQLRMTVSIRADGSVESIEINKSSGFKVLDDAARRIVELGAPYAPFPDNIRKDTDILGITRTWTFTREDTLGSSF